MDIIAITICVNYHDILKHMIYQNSKFLKMWYIVTSPNDKETIELIKELNIKNIVLLFYNDFFYKNATFNKGGSIKFAQEYIDRNHTNSNILLIDADIYLPDNFMEKLPKNLKDNTLYGTIERLDYLNINDFINNKNPQVYFGGMRFVGFFQLYKQTHKHKYSNSFNCSECDKAFRQTFRNKEHLQISVKHLGEAKINWNGRDLKNGKF